MEFQNTSGLTGLTENYAASDGSSLDTGDLRRAYASIPLPHVAYINVEQQPFFGILTKLRRKKVDETQFKFIEKRDSFHKRYAYVVGHGPSSISVTAQATIAAASLEVGDTYYWRMATDYKSAGNVGVIFDASGGTRSAFLPGASGTRPEFFIPGQMIKVPFVATGNSASTSNANSFNVVEYIICRIESVTLNTNNVDLKTKVITALSAERDLAGWGVTDGSGDAPLSTAVTAGEFAKLRVYDELERARVYVSGNAHAPGSGYPSSFKDNPYSSGYGQTQIFKASASMDGSTLATVFKYDGNEFQRQWGQIVLSYNSDIEYTALFGHQTTTTDENGKTIYLTQGAVDYALNYGNIFTLAHDSKNIDDFLVDMSTYFDVRSSNKSNSIFFVDKYTLNWFIQLTGFSFNNAAAVGAMGQMSNNYMGWRDIKLANMGKNKKASVRMYTLVTPYGDMNLIYDPHLDGTQVSIVGLNLTNMWVCPLVGNGYNRDTKIYVGVQTMENSGVDGRVDVIQGEIGLEFNDPAGCAVWKRS